MYSTRCLLVFALIAFVCGETKVTQTQSTSTSESCLETHSSSSSTSTSGQKCPGKNCDDECDTPEPPPVRCCGENQEYSEGFTQVCMVDLCTTFEFATPKDKCPNPATVKYAAQPGCKCKKNFALTKPGQCARIGSIECPAVANKTDCRFYRSHTCCPNPYEVYDDFRAIICLEDFCTTYTYDPLQKCPDIRLADFAPMAGCICMDGYGRSKDGVCAKVGTPECPEIADKLDCRFYDISTCCKDPNQIYVINQVIDPCQHEICTTAKLKRRCPDGRLTRPALTNGCRCRDGTAWTGEKCEYKYTCACPAIANPRDQRFYNNYECPEL